MIQPRLRKVPMTQRGGGTWETMLGSGFVRLGGAAWRRHRRG